MSISASSGSLDLIVRLGPGKSLFEDGRSAVVSGTAACTWNQGDLMCFDTTNNYLRPVAATGDAATFVGIADNQVSSGKLYSPYQGLTAVDASSLSPGFVGPKYGVIANLLINTGDSLTPGCKIYLLNGGTTQSCTVTDPGDHNYIGIYQGLTISSAAAGLYVPVLLGSRYPAATGAGLVF